MKRVSVFLMAFGLFLMIFACDFVYVENPFVAGDVLFGNDGSTAAEEDDDDGGSIGGGGVSASAPAGVTVVLHASTAQALTISWDSVAEATGYTVYYDTDADPAGASTADAGTGTTFDLTSLTAGTTYYIWVTATIPDHGESAYSLSATATPEDVPAAPAIISAVPGNLEVTLTWAAVDFADSYTVYFDDSDPFSSPQSKTVTGTTTTVDAADYGTIENGTAAWFWVEAVNDRYGAGPLSGSVSATPNTPPAAPSLTVFGVSGNELRANWSNLTCTGYQLVISDDITFGDADDVAYDIAGGTLQKVLTPGDLATGERYWAKVRAHNNGVYGPYSSTENVLYVYWEDWGQVFAVADYNDNLPFAFSMENGSSGNVRPLVAVLDTTNKVQLKFSNNTQGSWSIFPADTITAQADSSLDLDRVGGTFYLGMIESASNEFCIYSCYEGSSWSYVSTGLSDEINAVKLAISANDFNSDTVSSLWNVGDTVHCGVGTDIFGTPTWGTDTLSGWPKTATSILACDVDSTTDGHSFLAYVNSSGNITGFTSQHDTSALTGFPSSTHNALLKIKANQSQNELFYALIQETDNSLKLYKTQGDARNWGAPIDVSNDVSIDSYLADMAVDSNGDVYVVYVKSGKVYVWSTADNPAGEIWGGSVAIADLGSSGKCVAIALDENTRWDLTNNLVMTLAVKTTTGIQVYKLVH